MNGLRMLSIVGALSVAGLLMVAGCYKPNAPGGTQASAGSKVDGDHHAGDGHDHDHGKSGETAKHDHSGWWCAEHGVPEEICGLCSPKVAAELKAKGDWCDKHDRPRSQCFVCEPALEAKFAALYEAKFGKQPPKEN